MKLSTSQKDILLSMFIEHFPRIDDKYTCMWKIRSNANFLSEENSKATDFNVQCRNGTRNYITPDSCQPIIDKWNEMNPELKLKELKAYCVEDDEVWTWIKWDIDYE